MASLQRVHHTGLTVSDIEQSVLFYRDALGFELVARQETNGGYVGAIVGYPDAVTKKAYLKVPGDGPILELFQYVTPTGETLDPESKNVGAAHICFIVDDLASLYDDLLAKGARCVSPPIYVDEGPSAGGSALYLLDPDDIRIELFQLPAAGQKFD